MGCCRLCCRPERKHTLVNIFDPRFANGAQLRLFVKTATGVDIREDDLVTKSVCHICLNHAVHMSTFRTNAIKNDKMLKEQAGQKYFPVSEVSDSFEDVKDYNENKKLSQDVIVVLDDDDEVQAPAVSSSIQSDIAEVNSTTEDNIINEEFQKIDESDIVDESTEFCVESAGKVIIDTTEIIEYMEDDLSTIEHTELTSTTNLHDIDGSNVNPVIKDVNVRPLLPETIIETNNNNNIETCFDHSIVSENNSTNDLLKEADLIESTPQKNSLELLDNLDNSKENLTLNTSCEKNVLGPAQILKNSSVELISYKKVHSFVDNIQPIIDDFSVEIMTGEDDSVASDKLIIDEDVENSDCNSNSDILDKINSILNEPCKARNVQTSSVKIDKTVSELLRNIPGLILPEEAVTCNWSPILCLPKCAVPPTHLSTGITDRRYSNSSATSEEEILDDLLVISKFQKSEYICQYCSQVFKRKCRLVNHIRVHMTCEHCSKVFRKVSLLQVHLNESCHMLYSIKDCSIVIPRCNEIEEIYNKYKSAFEKVMIENYQFNHNNKNRHLKNNANFANTSQGPCFAQISVPYDNSKNFFVNLLESNQNTNKSRTALPRLSIPRDNTKEYANKRIIDDETNFGGHKRKCDREGNNHNRQRMEFNYNLQLPINPEDTIDLTESDSSYSSRSMQMPLINRQHFSLNTSSPNQHSPIYQQTLSTALGPIQIVIHNSQPPQAIPQFRNQQPHLSINAKVTHQVKQPTSSLPYSQQNFQHSSFSNNQQEGSRLRKEENNSFYMPNTTKAATKDTYSTHSTKPSVPRIQILENSLLKSGNPAANQQPRNLHSISATQPVLNRLPLPSQQLPSIVPINQNDSVPTSNTKFSQNQHNYQQADNISPNPQGGFSMPSLVQLSRPQINSFLPERQQSAISTNQQKLLNIPMTQKLSPQTSMPVVNNSNSNSRPKSDEISSVRSCAVLCSFQPAANTLIPTSIHRQKDLPKSEPNLRNLLTTNFNASLSCKRQLEERNYVKNCFSKKNEITQVNSADVLNGCTPYTENNQIIYKNLNKELDNCKIPVKINVSDGAKLTTRVDFSKHSASTSTNFDFRDLNVIDVQPREVNRNNLPVLKKISVQDYQSASRNGLENRRRSSGETITAAPNFGPTPSRLDSPENKRRRIDDNSVGNKSNIATSSSGNYQCIPNVQSSVEVNGPLKSISNLVASYPQFYNGKHYNQDKYSQGYFYNNGRDQNRFHYPLVQSSSMHPSPMRQPSMRPFPMQPPPMQQPPMQQPPLQQLPMQQPPMQQPPMQQPRMQPPPMQQPPMQQPPMQQTPMQQPPMQPPPMQPPPMQPPPMQQPPMQPPSMQSSYMQPPPNYYDSIQNSSNNQCTNPPKTSPNLRYCRKYPKTPSLRIKDPWEINNS